MTCAAGPRRQDRGAFTSTCASSGAGLSTRCGARRWPSPARWSGARPGKRPANGGKKNATASSSTTTRTRRIVPWRRPGRCGRRSTRACLAELGDAAAAIDAAPESLDKLLALSAAQEAAGLGDAPWPPHYKKQRDEPPRVAPSRRSAKVEKKGSGHRQSTQPLITVARAKHKEDALAGLERWKARHPEAAARLQVDDVLVDSMRGRSSTWTRIRINLRHVPESERSAEEPPDPDYDPWRGSEPGRPGERAPKTRSSS